MKEDWPPNITDEEASLRIFKDALMKRSRAAVSAVLFPEGKHGLHYAMVEVENAYAKVREHTPAELQGDDALTYGAVLIALRETDKRQRRLPPRRVLIHMLAALDYYFYKLASGYDFVYDISDLSNEERAAENGLRHNLLTRLYNELEPAFDVSLNWPPSGYEMNERGDLVRIRAELTGMAAIGYDYGYDAEIFYEGHADDEEYVRGFVEGCLKRIGEDEPEEEEFLRRLWEDGDEEDRNFALESLKGECEVRDGRFDDRPEIP